MFLWIASDLRNFIFVIILELLFRVFLFLMVFFALVTTFVLGLLLGSIPIWVLQYMYSALVLDGANNDNTDLPIPLTNIVFNYGLNI